MIHPTAVIGAATRCAADVELGPFVVCEGEVDLAAGVVIGAHAVLGGRPKIRGFAGPNGRIEVGARTFLGEHVTVDLASGAVTHVGADCYVMPHCYVAHDCWLEDHVTLTSGVQLGGHVRIGTRATFGLGTVVHQFSAIGAFAMIGMGSVLSRDVPPYAKAFGNPARVVGANRVGLSRSGLSDAQVAEVEAALREYLATGVWPIEFGRDQVAWFEQGRKRPLARG